MQKPRILILGVTASGKARLAFNLARRLGAEIISVDSMKIYRRMDIGTAKPSPENRAQVPYHMIDIVEPSETYNVGRFYEEAYQVVDRIEAQGKPAIAVGGTALYIKALLYGLFSGPGADEAVRAELLAQARTQGLPHLHQRLADIDPEAARRISPQDERRLVRALEVYQVTGKPISAFQTQFEAAQPRHAWHVIGLRRTKARESLRINQRVKRMMEAGLLEEVRSLLQEDPPMSQQSRAAIGYAELIDHLSGDMTLEQAVERIKINTRRFAKGQRTWYKTFRTVNWIDIREEDSPEAVQEQAMRMAGLKERM